LYSKVFDTERQAEDKIQIQRLSITPTLPAGEAGSKRTIGVDIKRQHSQQQIEKQQTNLAKSKAK